MDLDGDGQVPGLQLACKTSRRQSQRENTEVALSASIDFYLFDIYFCFIFQCWMVLMINPLSNYPTTKVSPPQMAENQESSKESSCGSRPRSEQAFPGGYQLVEEEKSLIAFCFKRSFFWKLENVGNLRSAPTSTHNKKKKTTTLRWTNFLTIKIGNEKKWDIRTKLTRRSSRRHWW